MAIKFEIYQSPNNGETQEKHYHARVVNSTTVNTSQLSQEIHQACSLTESDIKATLIELNRTLVRHLSKGERVHIEGLGYFHISLESPSVTDPKKIRATNVKFKSVTFRADKELKGELVNVHTETSQLKVHSSSIDEEKVNDILTTYFKKRPVIIRRDFEKLFSLTRSTAGRYIVNLVKQGKLKNISTPTSPIYILGSYYTDKNE